MRDPGRRKQWIEALDELPLLHRTPATWAELTADDLPCFLADHAVCEQQAALNALNLVAHYPEDAELVDRLTALAAEEVLHLRRLAALLHRRGLQPARRRRNPYVQALQARIEPGGEPTRKIDRLLVGALIEARSCERFTCLLQVIQDRDAEVADLLFDLGPAEKRHWELFHALALRVQGSSPAFDRRWSAWLRFEAEWMAGAGRLPVVHG